MSAAVARPLELADEDATLAAGARLARALRSQPGPVVVTLAGPLGAGKTTFVRGTLRELGVAGAIRSPSYTLVEEHAAGGWEVLHLDLYRLEGGDLHEFGLRDRLVTGTLLLVEWPERAGAGQLPLPDLALALDLSPGGHRLTGAARGAQGDALLQAILAAAPDESAPTSWNA